MKYRLIWLTGALLFLRLSLKGQAYHVPQRSVDIVNGCARLQPDLFSAVVNPAVMAACRGVRAAASAEDGWSLPELAYSRIMAVIPAGNGAAGLGVQHSGTADFQESGLDFGYGLPVNKGGVGILFHYGRFAAAGYAPVSTGAASFGLRLQLLPGLLTGMAFSVPFRLGKARNPSDKPAGDYRIELGLLLSREVSLFAAWVKTDGLAAAAEIGVDYSFADHFFFVAGLHGRTGAPFGKAGWCRNGWRLSLFTAWQPPLGFSPGLCFAWDRPAATKEEKQRKKESIQ